MTSPKAQKQPVVVTTEHRGVFFGYLDGDRASSTVTITEAQMCVYWSADVQGMPGLAATGPSKTCKVSPAVPGATTLQGVTAVFDATEAAAKAWKDRPWR